MAASIPGSALEGGQSGSRQFPPASQMSENGWGPVPAPRAHAGKGVAVAAIPHPQPVNKGHVIGHAPARALRAELGKGGPRGFGGDDRGQSVGGRLARMFCYGWGLRGQRGFWWRDGLEPGPLP